MAKSLLEGTGAAIIDVRSPRLLIAAIYAGRSVEFADIREVKMLVPECAEIRECGGTIKARRSGTSQGSICDGSVLDQAPANLRYRGRSFGRRSAEPILPKAHRCLR